MNKHILGRKLGRDMEERKALFKGLISAFVLSDKIKTTEAKAKAIKPQIEKLVTKAKREENSARKILEKSLTKDAFNRLINEVAPSFASRNSGYTRLTRMGNRLGDNTTMVLLEWTEIITRKPILKEKTKTEKPSPVKVNGKKTLKSKKEVKRKSTVKKQK